MKQRIKTWHYWHGFFSKMFKEIDAMLPRYQGGPLSIWCYTSKSERKILAEKWYFEANVACRDYIANGYWDEALSADILCAVLVRVETAVDFCLNLNLWQGSKSNVVIRPPDPSITPYDKILSFFLLTMHKDTQKQCSQRQESDCSEKIG